MRLPMTACLLVGAVVLTTTGCAHRRDQVVINELENENQRLASRNDDLQNMVAQVTQERNAALENAAKQREQAEGLSKQLQGMVGTGGGMLPKEVFDVSGNRLILKQDFAFNLGSAKLSPQGLAGVEKLADLLNSLDYQQAHIIVEGHTDNTKVSRSETIKRFGDNWGLSAMRAAAVIRHLQDKGVSPARLHGMFSGEYSPRAMGNDKEAKARNRRVEIYLANESP